MSDNKFYWLKLNKDFFDRNDIRVIESMPNGKDYVLFYLKLLLKSIENEGNLRFTDTIPYNEDMLSTITDTNIDVVRAAMKILTSTGLIEILDDDTIFMSEVQSMIGSAVNNDNANRQRRFRNKKKAEETRRLDSGVTKCNANVTGNVTNNNESIEIEKELDIEIDKDISPKVDISLEKETKAKKEKFAPPTVEEVRTYCLERGNNIDPETFVDFYTSKNWMVGKTKMKDWKASVRTWERNSKNRQTSYKPKQVDTFMDDLDRIARGEHIEGHSEFDGF